MAVTDAQLQALILSQVNDTAAGDAANALPVLWDFYASKRTIAPRLQFWYAKRGAIDVLLGAVRKSVSFAEPGGLSIQQNLLTDNLRKMRLECDAEILTIERKAKANRTPTVGTITTVEARTPPTTPPDNTYPADANDPAYGGDVYTRVLRQGVL